MGVAKSSPSTSPLEPSLTLAGGFFSLSHMYGATTVESDFSPGRKSIVQPKNYYSLFHESVTSEQWNCFDVLRLLELSNQAVISACISRTMRLQLIVSQKLSFLNYIDNNEVSSNAKAINIGRF